MAIFADGGDGSSVACAFMSEMISGIYGSSQMCKDTHRNLVFIRKLIFTPALGLLGQMAST